MKELLSAPLSPRKLIEYLLLFLLLAFVLSAAAYGGYWYGRKERGAAPTKPQPVSKTSTIPRGGLIVEGWQTYSDPEVLQISLEFPADWVVMEEAHLGKSAPTFGTGNQPGKHSGSLMVSRRELSSWGENAQLEDTFELSSDEILKEDTLTIGGERALRKEVWESNFQGRSGAGLTRKHVRLLHGQNVYQISYYEEASDKKLTSSAEWQLNAIFDHLLSTFRFLDQR